MQLTQVANSMLRVKVNQVIHKYKYLILRIKK